ncbi:unnamed protein product [Chrysoparadoxa australica]
MPTQLRGLLLLALVVHCTSGSALPPTVSQPTPQSVVEGTCDSVCSDTSRWRQASKKHGIDHINEDCYQVCHELAMSRSFGGVQQGTGDEEQGARDDADWYSGQLCDSKILMLMFHEPLLFNKAVFASARVEEAAAAMSVAYDKLKKGATMTDFLWNSDLITDYGLPDMCRHLEGMHNCRIVTEFARRPLSPLWGVCIPEQCGTDALPLYLEAISSLTSLPFRVECGDYHYQPDLGYGVTVAVIAVLVVFALAGTSLERNWLTSKEAHFYELGAVEEMAADEDKLGSGAMSMERENVESTDQGPVQYRPALQRALLCFALPSAWSKLWSHKPPGHHGEYRVLDGIRFLSVTWVVLGHCCAYYIDHDPGASNLLSFLGRNGQGKTAEFNYQPLVSAFFSADSFLQMSGMLAVLVGLPKVLQIEKAVHVSWIYLLRWIRLTPVLLLAGLVNLFILPILQWGPHYNNNDMWETCSKYWWTNLFYLQNWIPGRGHECLGEAWYLAVDFQLFLAVPWILLLHKRNKKWSWSILIATTVSSIGYSLVLAYKHDFHFSVFDSFLDEKGTASYKQDYYYNTFCRCPPYLIGMMAGLAWHDWFRYVRFTRCAQFFTAFLWCNFLFWPAFGSKWGYENFPSTLPLVMRALYIALAKPTWAVGLSLLCFQCFADQGGIVQWILGVPVMFPMARLSYGIFLLHNIPAYMFFRSARTQFHPTRIQLAFADLSVLVLGALASILMYLLLECPIKRLSDEFIVPKLKLVKQHMPKGLERTPKLGNKF